jgi:hypothetical protein
MTILRYGNYSHADSECIVTIDNEALMDERGHRWAVKQTWDVDGYLQSDSTGGLIAAIAALQNAYARDGGDLTLLFGGAVMHQLLNKYCLGGTHVMRPPSFPQGKGAEGTTFRTFHLSVEGTVVSGVNPNLIADNPGDTSAIQLLQWKETVTLTGGGPLFVMRITLTGPPVRQKTAEQTPCVAIQVGNAVGRYDWAPFPGPLFPADEHRSQRTEERGAPESKNGQLINYPTSWRYVQESATPLVGNPHLPPG